MTVFISPDPRQHFCLSTPSENGHAFSGALPIAKYLRLVSIWLKRTALFRFNTKNLHRYFRCTHWTPKKKFLHTLYHKKTRKNLCSHEKSTQNFLCTKKTTQNFTCIWPEHSTIASSWMLKCNAFAVVVVAEKMWISQNMLWLPCSGRMSRL